jgi:hypothetical protein
MKLSIVFLAVLVLIELVWFVGMDRYVEHRSVSIESTELSFNPWPAPGGETDIAGERSKAPLSASTAAHHGPTGVTAR